MKPTPTLDAYFARIGDAGSRAPTLATLNRIIEAHVRTVPFENLDILLGQPISLQLEDVIDKLVHRRRGGYCFEQNSLLEHVLKTLGFDIRPISARVRIERPRSYTPSRTHLFLRVELDGQSWLVDVGVGALSPTSALRLELDTPQSTPHETRRIIARGKWTGFEQRAPDAVLYHQAWLGDAWKDVCEFTLEEMPPIDRELGNWYTSTHSASPFQDVLMVARSTDAGGRITLLNRELKTRGTDGQVEKRTLRSHEELVHVLREQFGLNFAAGTRFSCSAYMGTGL